MERLFNVTGGSVMVAELGKRWREIQRGDYSNGEPLSYEEAAAEVLNRAMRESGFMPFSWESKQDNRRILGLMKEAKKVIKPPCDNCGFHYLNTYPDKGCNGSRLKRRKCIKSREKLIFKKVD